MDFKEKIEQIVDKIQSDKTLLSRFQKNPAKVVEELIEELIGVDVPSDQVEKIVDAVTAKIKLDKLGSALGGLGNLFGK